MIRRREFIAGFVGAAGWQLAALAQQPDTVRRIGFLHALAENDPETQARVAMLREGLAQLGWTERNVRIEQRFGEGDAFARLALLGLLGRHGNPLRIRPYFFLPSLRKMRSPEYFTCPAGRERNAPF
jgi:hypothetical protein